jgi:hypothetical protein
MVTMTEGERGERRGRYEGYGDENEGSGPLNRASKYWLEIEGWAKKGKSGQDEERATTQPDFPG